MFVLQIKNTSYFQVTYMSFTTASLAIGKAGCHPTVKYALHQWLIGCVSEENRTHLTTLHSPVCSKPCMAYMLCASCVIQLVVEEQPSFPKGCSRNYPRGWVDEPHFFFQTPPPPRHTCSQRPPTLRTRKCFS